MSSLVQSATTAEIIKNKVRSPESSLKELQKHLFNGDLLLALRVLNSIPKEQQGRVFELSSMTTNEEDRVMRFVLKHGYVTKDQKETALIRSAERREKKKIELLLNEAEIADEAIVKARMWITLCSDLTIEHRRWVHPLLVE